jgi:hypothetical protein
MAAKTDRASKYAHVSKSFVERHLWRQMLQTMERFRHPLAVDLVSSEGYRLALKFCGPQKDKSSGRLSVNFCIAIFNFPIEGLFPMGSAVISISRSPLTMVDPWNH